LDEPDRFSPVFPPDHNELVPIVFAARRLVSVEVYIGNPNASTSTNIAIFPFLSFIISEYVYAYSTGIIDTATPIDIKRMRPVIGDQILIEKELIEAYSIISNEQQELMRNFFKVMT
jgi:hypothetical protein